MDLRENARVQQPANASLVLLGMTALIVHVNMIVAFTVVATIKIKLVFVIKVTSAMLVRLSFVQMHARHVGSATRLPVSVTVLSIGLAKTVPPLSVLKIVLVMVHASLDPPSQAKILVMGASCQCANVMEVGPVSGALHPHAHWVKTECSAVVMLTRA